MINIVIPMAGRGQRFKDAGYDTYKPLLRMPSGKTMIEEVVDNIGLPGAYIFIVNKNMVDIKELGDIFADKPFPHQFVTIDEVTRGAAETVLAAKLQIDSEVPLLIANCDQLVEWNPEYFKHIIQGPGSHLDGIIQVFLSDNPAYSYVKIDSEDFVTQVAEKEVIGEFATTGLYYWKHGSMFVKYAEQMITSEKTQHGEYYVCPVYQEAIDDGHRIGTYIVTKMIPLGTPEEFEKYKEETSSE